MIQATFKLGDKVKWVSQSGGHTAAKGGRVVRVLPPNTRIFPGDFCSDMNVARSRFHYGGGMMRNHESYVIETPDKHYYWPRVSALRAVKCRAGA